MTIVDRVWRWPYELSAFLRPGSSLFYSLIVDGKKEFSKKLCFLLRRGFFSVKEAGM